MKWYHIGYDTQGAGFMTIKHPYAYAYGEEELEGSIDYAVNEMGIDEEQICVFELKDK